MSSNFQKAFDLAFAEADWNRIAKYQQVLINPKADAKFAKECAMFLLDEIGYNIDISDYCGVVLEFDDIGEDDIHIRCTIMFGDAHSCGHSK